MLCSKPPCLDLHHGICIRRSLLQLGKSLQKLPMSPMKMQSMVLRFFPDSHLIVMLLLLSLPSHLSCTKLLLQLTLLLINSSCHVILLYLILADIVDLQSSAFVCLTILACPALFSALCSHFYSITGRARQACDNICLHVGAVNLSL